jgi:hypothetical protein
MLYASSIELTRIDGLVVANDLPFPPEQPERQALWHSTGILRIDAPPY